MIDYEPVDVPKTQYEQGYVKIEPKSKQAAPKKVKLEKEPEPKPAIPEPPANVDTSRINETSRAFAAQSVAKLMILLTWLSAVGTRTPPLMMKDEEAIAIAIPLTTLLLRMKWFADLFKEYGQYFLSFDEWIMLAVAFYAYYSRVEREMERSNPEHEPTKPIREQPTSNEHIASNGLTGITRPVAWRNAI